MPLFGRDYCDRQRRNPVGQFDIERKQVKLCEYLSKNDTTAIRTRAHPACNSYSISHFSDSKIWCYEDLLMLTYESALNSDLKQDIDILYVVHTYSKTASVSDHLNCKSTASSMCVLKDDSPPMLKLIRRRHNVFDCPMGSLAMYVAWRYLVLKEPLPEMEKSKREW